MITGNYLTLPSPTLPIKSFQCALANLGIGYLYRHPQYTIKRIQEASDEVHLGKVLDAVAEGLDLNLSDEYREVLSSCSMTRR